MSRGEIAVIEGNTFAISDAIGDILPGTAHGFFHDDTRFLSGYTMKVNNQRPVLLSSRNLSHDSACFYCTNPDLNSGPLGSMTIVRDRSVGNGLYDRVVIENHSTSTMFILIEFEFAADFADVFEVRGAQRKRERTVLIAQCGEGFDLGFSYERPGFSRRTLVCFSPRPIIEGTKVRFNVCIGPKEKWDASIHVLTADDPVPLFDAAETQPARPPMVETSQATHSWQTDCEPGHGNRERAAPKLVTDDMAMRRAFRQAVDDLEALRLVTATGHVAPAAGLPWYLAVFGRDSVITALQTMVLGSELAVGTLHSLAHYQGHRVDSFRDEQPGKIPHEIRVGELAHLDEIPHSRYYGTVDATPLYLILLSETFRWTGDSDLIRQLMPVAELALEWIDRYGDIDGDGFIEYQRRSSHGLVNQGWKDSTDSVCFSDGRLAEGPIALVEAQGYVYDAKVRLAELYLHLGMPARAEELRNQADDLKARFDQAFWMPEAGYYAMALDGAKRQVDSISSNPGHCLWSRIVPEERAEAVVTRLMADDMFSGWGIRTLSSLMARYNPLSYHNGSVWPHDNSIIAAGFRRYGFDREARRVAEAMFDASSHFSLNRLPELFAGYPRRSRGFPVRYPEANAPQAWSSGAVISLVQTLLGVQPEDGVLRVDPVEGIARLELLGVPFRGRRLDITAQS